MAVRPFSPAAGSAPVRRLVGAEARVVRALRVAPGAALVLRRALAGRGRGVGAGDRVGAHAAVTPAGLGQVLTSTIGMVSVSGDGSFAPSAIAIRPATASGSLNRSKLWTRR